MTLYANGIRVCPTICLLTYLLNLDGGKAYQVYTAEQKIDGGNASSTYTINERVTGGKAQWQ